MIEQSAFRAVDVEPMDVHADSNPTSAHLHWRVALAPEAETDIGGRVVYATLHARGQSGGGQVTVAGLILHHPKTLELSLEEFRDGIDESDALECFYDAARGALRLAAALVNVVLEVPTKAPPPEYGLLRKREAMIDEEISEDGD
ncbi:MAG: hypothetical protein KJ659_02745 [Actinobacteria bacterium]|nr:hypothetical protein [Actinomycetota bacterium]MBU1609122.1 hypothetical protein [Actinomycetota bacterium]MBU2314748.1 hypothetical protein [Actinomycetota bacterium]MBU2384405.1 hypothetical protein [Actinomycetota bacterium]